MKITLIEPRSPGVHVFSKVKVPRLGLPILGTILKSSGHEVRIYVEEIQAPQLSRVAESDLVGISTITSTAPRAYHMADRLKDIDPDLPVVLGGPHVSFEPEEALQHADYCVLGEGERSFPRLIEALASGGDARGISGVAYRQRGKAVLNSPAEKVKVSDVPFPDMKLIEGWETLRLSPLSRRILPFHTSRGCPHGCRFCSVISLFGRQYRFRPVTDVISRLKEHDGAVIFFYDDNFAADRSRTKKLLRGMIDAGVDIEWSAQVRADVASDPEILQLMVQAGATMLHIGFESVNQSTLQEYEKNQTVEQMVESIETIHHHGLRIHGMFVIGSDADDPSTPRRTVDFALQHGIDTIQLMMLTPIPGTPLYEDFREEGRLITDRWEYYDGHHVVFKPARMTPYQMQYQVMKELARFYSLRRCLNLAARLQFVNSYFGFYGWRTVRRWMRDLRKKGYMSFLQKNFAT